MQCGIISVMKRIPTQKNGFWKRFFINIPFVLMVALMVAFFGAGLLLFFYSWVSVAAFNSAMIYLIVAGASAICIGLGLILIPVYQKYYAFYNKKMGWKFVSSDGSDAYDYESLKANKTVTYDNKNMRARDYIKKYLTVGNVAICVLALGSVFAIISAALGCIDRSNWVRDVGSYKEKRGYYTDVRNEPIKFDVNGSQMHGQKKVSQIEIKQSENYARQKEIIVIYSLVQDRQGFVEISGYKKFENDFSASRRTDINGDTLTVSVGDAPKLDSSLDKLLFFIFDDYAVEKQIFVYIPYSERENITVNQADKVFMERMDNGTVVLTPLDDNH